MKIVPLLKISTEILPICGVSHSFCYGSRMFILRKPFPRFGTNFFKDFPMLWNHFRQTSGIFPYLRNCMSLRQHDALTCRPVSRNAIPVRVKATVREENGKLLQSNINVPSTALQKCFHENSMSHNWPLENPDEWKISCAKHGI